MRGVEPRTSCMPCKRSNQMSYIPSSKPTLKFRFAVRQKLQPNAMLLLSKFQTAVSCPVLKFWKAATCNDYIELSLLILVMAVT